MVFWLCTLKIRSHYMINYMTNYMVIKCKQKKREFAGIENI